MELRVAFRTLGCKLNQLETEALAEAFRKVGARVVDPAGGEAELFVLNTCTVTGKAEQKARRSLRQALAAQPRAVALVTGCYAQLDPGALAALDERAVVVPGDEKARILSLAAWLGERWQGHGDLLDAVLEWRSSGGADGEGNPFAFVPERQAHHSRPSLKVQDGCDNRCSYCRVCLARGASRSLPVAEALARARRLEESGSAEIVLTGVNLFQYRDGERRFPDLLAALLAGTSAVAFRLSSWEPEGVDASFLEVFAEPRVRPHLHLPVQSGSDAILASMARAYRRDRVLAACEELRRVKGEPFLAADLIAGFPGEGEAEFAETLDLARRCRFAWIHAFPFSPRPGTAAWDLRPRVPEGVAGERVLALGELAKEGRGAYVAAQVGRVVEAVAEAGGGGSLAGTGEDAFRATSANYLKLFVRKAEGGMAEKVARGQAVLCRVGAPAVRGLTRATGGGNRGTGGDSSPSLSISRDLAEGADEACHVDALASLIAILGNPSRRA